MRKVPITGKAPLRRWQVQMRRLMSNPKQIRKGASGGEPALLSLGPFRQRRRRRAISFNGSLECTRDQHLRHHPRRRAAGAEQQDELRSEPLRQDQLSLLMTAQLLQFYDRQGKKDFGAFLSKDRQQDHTQCGKTRIPRRSARERPAGGIQRRT